MYWVRHKMWHLYKIHIRLFISAWKVNINEKVPESSEWEGVLGCPRFFSSQMGLFFSLVVFLLFFFFPSFPAEPEEGVLWSSPLLLDWIPSLGSRSFPINVAIVHTVLRSVQHVTSLFIFSPKKLNVKLTKKDLHNHNLHYTCVKKSPL